MCNAVGGGFFDVNVRDLKPNPRQPGVSDGEGGAADAACHNSGTGGNAEFDGFVGGCLIVILRLQLKFKSVHHWGARSRVAARGNSDLNLRGIVR